MKISKVDHTRTAVSVARKTPKGIIYKTPKQSDNSVMNVASRYKMLNDRAKKLYGILNPATGDEGESEKNIRKVVNCLTKDLLRCIENDNLESTLSKQLRLLVTPDTLPNIPNKGITDKQIDNLINLNLRRSLRVNVAVNDQCYYLPDILSEYLKGLLKCRNRKGRWNFSRLIDSVDADKLTEFLKVVINDYSNQKKVKNTIKSIEKQRVHVKVINMGSRSLLVPSNADHKKKGHIFSFMRSYAAGSEDKKRQLLVNMRILLVLYLHGGDDAEHVIVNEKSFCNELLKGDLLVPELVKIISEIALLKQECRDINDEISKLDQQKAEEKNVFEEEKASKVADIRKKRALMEMTIDKTLEGHYRKALSIENCFWVEGDPQQLFHADRQEPHEFRISSTRFWLDYFDNEARKILLGSSKIDMYKLDKLWLGTRIWNNWTAYIAQKFVDYGKAVYRFVLPEEFNMGERGVSFGEVLPKYKQGISSFEYERIKAKENIERSTAVAVTFAANTFSRAVLKSIPMKENKKSKQMEPVEDILFANKSVYKSALYPDAGKRLLRYFGGISSWKGNENVMSLAEKECGVDLVESIRLSISALRNDAFHYTSAKSEIDTTNLRKLFNQEKMMYSSFIRKKYYSNNVFRFYEEDTTKKLLDYLYEKPSNVPAQVPSFARLFNRDTAYMHERLLDMSTRNQISARGSDEVVKFKGTFYYLLKEVYYNAFLQDSDCTKRFIKKIDQSNSIKVENKYALASFKNRLKAMKQRATLGEICQQIMTDYNIQNQDKRVRKSTNNEEEVYKHFVLLLYQYMRETFVDYFLEKKTLFGFILKPLFEEAWVGKTEDNYLSGWTCGTYKGFLQDKNMLKWYVLAHFLSPKHLNHLTGAFKSYGVFINDIERRAGDTGNRTEKEIIRAESVRIKSIVDMLVFSSTFCGMTTNIIEDYFEDKEEYDKMLIRFVEQDKDNASEDVVVTKKSCGEKKHLIGIYYDAANPIINRNMIRALMYGDLRMLCQIWNTVTIREIKNYNKLKENLSGVFEKGTCTSKEEQKKLREFQSEKNRIELHDLLTFTEIISDLNGQLVNWSYFRERDLMYMQLGVQYTKLFFTNTIGPEDIRRKISGKGFSITDGAMLYQIVALYNFGLPLYGFDETKKGRIVSNAGASVGKTISKFITNYCDEDVYYEGLFFFENIGEHEAITETRNYIDHFKYYADHKRSLLDLYSEVYERFFNYSVNYRKSVSYILPNILERYFIVLNTEMDKGERLGRNGKESRYHTVAGIRVKKVSSANFTYKLKVGNEEKKYQIPAHSGEFLTTVKKILEYKAEN